MALYRNILLALDFFPEGQQVVDKALALARANDATLNLVHVLEPLGAFYSESLLVNMETQVHDSARQRILKVGKELSIDSDHCFLRIGSAAQEIKRVATENNVDLIVIGGHGQSGWQILLGSTANSVLHGTDCDVLVVRIDPPD